MKIIYKNGGGFAAKYLKRIPKGIKKCDTVLLSFIQPTKGLSPKTKIKDIYKAQNFYLTYDEAAAIIRVLAEAMHEAMPRAERK